MCSYYAQGVCPYEDDRLCIHWIRGTRVPRWHLCNLKVPKFDDKKGIERFMVCGGEHLPYDCPQWEEAFREASHYSEFRQRFRMPAMDGMPEGRHAADRGRGFDRQQVEAVARGENGPAHATDAEIREAMNPTQRSPPLTPRGDKGKGGKGKK